MTKRGRRSRLFRLLAAACVAGSVTVAVGGGAGPAGGQTDEEPLFPESYLVQYGWWNKAQQTPDGGTGVPKPPNAPENGIYIAYEAVGGNAPTAVTGPVSGGALPDSPTDDAVPPPEQQVLAPTAYGAVRFEAPEGAEGRLTLSLLNRSSSTPGGIDPQAGVAMACVATSPWDPVQNGRFDGAPSYDCTAATGGSLNGDQLIFDVPAHLQQGRVLDLVIVPVGSQPYTMSIDAPTDASYVITNLDELLPDTEEEVFTPDDSPIFDSGGGFVPPQESYDFGTTALPEPPATTMQEATPRQQAELTQPVRNPLRPDASRVEQIAAVAVLLLLAAGLWWFGGKEARPPRLLGSLGNKQAALVPVGHVPASAPVRGIGRFARPRLGSAPRL